MARRVFPAAPYNSRSDKASLALPHGGGPAHGAGHGRILKRFAAGLPGLAPRRSSVNGTLSDYLDRAGLALHGAQVSRAIVASWPITPEARRVRHSGG